jgi:two-component system response regulator DesR
VIRVLLAEDQAMVRGALAGLLSLEPDIEVVAQVARGDEVLEAALAQRPDVALLDIEMPGADGLEAAAQLRGELPDCKVLMLTTFGRPGYLRRAMEEGAAGFLLKDDPADELARAIRRAVRGERVVDPGLAAAALSEGPSPLTARERDVLAARASTRRWPTSRRSCTSRRGRSATTSRPQWERWEDATALRRSAPPRRRGGSEPSCLPSLNGQRFRGAP